MKKLITITVFILSLSTTKAQSVLRLINNTSKPVSCAIAHYDEHDRYWVCEGWYTVEPYKKKDIDFRDYVGKVYIHGAQSAYFGLSETTWGEGYSLCVDPKNEFKIRDADHVNCDTKRNFSERKMYDGINNWEFNPK